MATANDRVKREIASATKNGEISATELDRIIAENLGDFPVPEGFDLASELAKDLKYLHPRNYELIDISAQHRKN